MSEILDIVNENDEIIGQINRDDTHRAGHIFRMVFVGFYTPEKNIILQRRSMLKKSSPGLLTATASGHVSHGQTYNEAAVRETLEETGVVVDEAKLRKLGVILGDGAMRAMYAYPYDDAIDELIVEENEGDGFIETSVKALRAESTNQPDIFAPFIRGSAADILLDYIERAD